MTCSTPAAVLILDDFAVRELTAWHVITLAWIVGLPALSATLAGMAIGFGVLAGLVITSIRTAHRSLARSMPRFPTER